MYLVNQRRGVGRGLDELSLLLGHSYTMQLTVVMLGNLPDIMKHDWDCEALFSLIRYYHEL